MAEEDLDFVIGAWIHKQKSRLWGSVQQDERIERNGGRNKAIGSYRSRTKRMAAADNDGGRGE
ncbi:hypothetical protein LOY98_005989, partial [Ophidiomyces ophidiicola]